MKQTVEEAWHYTTGAGLLNILQRHRLWASSAAFMNDADEVRTGKRALQDAAKARPVPLQNWQVRQLKILGVLSEGRPDNVFLLSASANGDALTLWRSYGQGTEAEYALRFDTSVELTPVAQSPAESHPAPPPGWEREILGEDDEGHPMWGEDPDEPYIWGGDWGKVRYLSADSTWASDELERVVAELTPPKGGSLRVPFIGDYFTEIDPSVLCKNPGFEDEREVRMTWTVHPWWKFVRYRTSRFGLTPYIEVAAANASPPSDLEQARHFINPDRVGRLPLQSVRVGPTRASSSAQRALRELLDSQGYGATEVLTSSAPYR